MKKQIPFDFALWGQEGISVEFNGKPVYRLHQYKNETYYGICIDGGFFERSECFTMYQEVKPREIWVNVYDDLYGKGYTTLEEAKRNALSSTLGQVKFREVLNEE